MRAGLLSPLAILLLMGCMAPVPPAAVAPREMTPVAASFGQTWDAVIDVFAERNIAIRTVDRRLGLIAAEPMGVGAVVLGQPHRCADCGRNMWGAPEQPALATWNILVRGDSTRSQVRATVPFVTAGSSSGGIIAPGTECSSRGVWETEVEESVRDRAEDRA